MAGFSGQPELWIIRKKISSGRWLQRSTEVSPVPVSCQIDAP